MNIGMTLPVMESALNRELIKSWCRIIDDGHWGSIALGERIVFDNPEFVTTLSSVAAWTENVEIISTVSILPMHNPILCAKQFATIDMISEGRFTLGVGVGGRREDYEAIEAQWSNTKWKRVISSVEKMRSVWNDSYHQSIGPKPIQVGGPKILAGAIGPKAVEMAASYADGIAGFSFDADVEDIANSFKLAEKNFKNKRPRMITSFWFALGSNSRIQMKRHLSKYLAWMGNDIANTLSDSAGFCGTVEELRLFLDEIELIGFDDVLLVPTSSDISQLEELKDIF